MPVRDGQLGTVALVSKPAPRILRLDDDALRLFDELRREAMERARSARGLAAGWHGNTDDARGAPRRPSRPGSGSTGACISRARRAGVTVHRRRLTRPWLGPSPTRNEPALAEPAIIKQENPGSECDHDLLPLGAARSICG